MICLKQLSSLVAVALFTGSVSADVWLDYQWGEGMTLQRGVKAGLHGQAKPGERVMLEFRGTKLETDADKFGKWRIEVEPGNAGGPFTLTLTAQNRIELKDVHVADLKLASILGDGMVLQRGSKTPVFGTAVPGAKVRVTFRERSYEAKVGDDGSWRVDVTPGEAGGPFPMTIAGPATLRLEEVFVGEVWVCSGQSNMNWPVIHTKDFQKLPLDKPNTQLRLLRFPDLSYAPNHPQARFSGWRPADKKSVLAFSGTGYYFGAALQEKLQVPVGLIHAAVDATGIQEWMPGDKLKQLKLGSAVDGGHYARRIRSMQPFAIRGVIWYQGESNANKDVFGIGYHPRLAAMIEGWRRDWGQGDFPFLYVQLPRIGFGAEQVHQGKLPTAEQKETVGEWARVRDEQRRVLSMVPHTAMAIYYEQTTGMLHPPEKKYAGERLALAARALAYGEKIEHSGPLFDSATREGNDIVLRFTHAAGLNARDGAPRQFEVAGADGKFVSVAARIDGATVRLAIGDIVGPVTVRYAHREWPDGNLFNDAGLPASPFVAPDVR